MKIIYLVYFELYYLLSHKCTIWTGTQECSALENLHDLKKLTGLRFCLGDIACKDIFYAGGLSVFPSLHIKPSEPFCLNFALMKKSEGKTQQLLLFFCIHTFSSWVNFSEQDWKKEKKKEQDWILTWVIKMHRHDSPDGRFQSEQPLCCLDSLPHITGQHADTEELTYIPVALHFLQAAFSSQQTVQPDTWIIWILDKVKTNLPSFYHIM